MCALLLGFQSHSALPCHCKDEGCLGTVITHSSFGLLWSSINGCVLQGMDSMESSSSGCVCYPSQSKPAMENFAVSAATLRNSAKKALKAHHSFMHLLWMSQQMGLCLFQKILREVAMSLKTHNKSLPNNVVTNTTHNHFWAKSQTFLSFSVISAHNVTNCSLRAALSCRVFH